MSKLKNVEQLKKAYEELEREFTKKNQQLAEAQKTIEIEGLGEEIDELKQQLEEKELHYKSAECEKWKADYKNCSDLEKIMTKEHQYCLDNWIASEQDKISFAIEQLEKVLPIIKATIELAESRYQMKDQVDIIIDNQIKTLRGEK